MTQNDENDLVVSIFALVLFASPPVLGILYVCCRIFIRDEDNENTEGTESSTLPISIIPDRKKPFAIQPGRGTFMIVKGNTMDPPKQPPCSQAQDKMYRDISMKQKVLKYITSLISQVRSNLDQLNPDAFWIYDKMVTANKNHPHFLAGMSAAKYVVACHAAKLAIGDKTRFEGVYPFNTTQTDNTEYIYNLGLAEGLYDLEFTIGKEIMALHTAYSGLSDATQPSPCAETTASSC
jgi:hypothetical protein